MKHTLTQAHSQIVSLTCRPSPCPLCQRSSSRRKWGAERGRCYCLLENTLRQTRARTNMHRQSDKSVSIATLLMEILPSRCALLEEHMECETGLCMPTGSEPVTTIWAAPGGYRRCVCVCVCVRLDLWVGAQRDSMRAWHQKIGEWKTSRHSWAGRTVWHHPDWIHTADTVVTYTQQPFAYLLCERVCHWLSAWRLLR